MTLACVHRSGCITQPLVDNPTTDQYAQLSIDVDQLNPPPEATFTNVGFREGWPAAANVIPPSHNVAMAKTKTAFQHESSHHKSHRAAAKKAVPVNAEYVGHAIVGPMIILDLYRARLVWAGVAQVLV